MHEECDSLNSMQMILRQAMVELQGLLVELQGLLVEEVLPHLLLRVVVALQHWKPGAQVSPALP